MQSRFRDIFVFNQYFLLWKKKLYKPDQKFVEISRSLRNTDSCPVLRHGTSSHRDTAETGRAPDSFPSSSSEKCHTITKCCWCGFMEAQTAQQGKQGSDLSEEECRGGRSLGRLTLCIRMSVTPWLRTGSCPHYNQLPVSLSPWGRCWMSRRSISKHVPMVQLNALHLLSVAFKITPSEFAKVWLRLFLLFHLIFFCFSFSTLLSTVNILVWFSCFLHLSSPISFTVLSDEK